MEWDEMRWTKLRRHEMRSVEMRRDDTDRGDNGMQWATSKRSCVAMRSGEMRKDSRLKKWHQIDKSRACCCEARKAWQQPIGTVFAPLYRPEAFQIWNFHPRLDRELLVWMGRLQARMGSEIHNAVWWFEIHVFLPYMDGILNCPKLWVKTWSQQRQRGSCCSLVSRLKKYILAVQISLEQKDQIGFDPMASTAFLAGERLKAGSIWFHLLVARLARLIAWGDRLFLCYP